MWYAQDSQGYEWNDPRGLAGGWKFAWGEKRPIMRALLIPTLTKSCGSPDFDDDDEGKLRKLPYHGHGAFVRPAIVPTRAPSVISTREGKQ